MDIKVEIQPKDIIANVLTPVEPIYGGTKNYENLENLPSINGIEIIGNLTLKKLGIQPQGDYAERSELPKNVSDLNNDAGYLVQSNLTDYAKLENMPTKVSQLENDSDYATKSDLPTKTSELENDSNYAKTTDIPTDTSQLNNDSDFAYVSDIPTNVSELNNDSNYLVRSDISNLDNHVIDTDNPHKVTKEQVGIGNVDNTSDADKPLSIAQKKYIDDSYANSNAYTDQKIADLIGGAPETLDTLKEVADAIAESKDVEEALNMAIGTKANQTELDTHTGNDTIHITSTERENWNDANDKKHTHSNKSILDKITQTLLDNLNAAYNHISDTIKHITSAERIAWNNKYDKPTSGIPKSDLSNEVQTSLGKADTALQKHQDISGLATKTELENHATANTIAFDAINSNLSTHIDATKVDIANSVSFGSLTLQSGRYGYEWKNLKKGKYILAVKTSSQIYYGINTGSEWESTGSITNEEKTVELEIKANGYAIVLWQGSGATSNQVSELNLYSPYIGDVVDVVNGSLVDYGLDNKFDGIWTQGYINQVGNFVTSEGAVTTAKGMSCDGAKTVTVKSDKSREIYIFFYTSSTISNSNYISNISTTGKELTVNVPSNAKYCFVCIVEEGITPSNISRISVYMNNAIDEINESLAEQGLIDIADNQYFVGYYTNVDTKEHNSANIYISDTSIISVQEGDLITVRVPKNNSCKIGISFMNTATTGTDYVSDASVTEFSAIAPTGAYKAFVWMRKTDIVQSDFERIHIYKNNSIAELKNDLATLFSSNITGIKLNGSTLEVSFNNGTSVGKVSFEGIAEEETIIS